MKTDITDIATFERAIQACPKIEDYDYSENSFFATGRYKPEVANCIDCAEKAECPLKLLLIKGTGMRMGENDCIVGLASRINFEELPHYK